MVMAIWFGLLCMVSFCAAFQVLSLVEKMSVATRSRLDPEAFMNAIQARFAGTSLTHVLNQTEVFDMASVPPAFFKATDLPLKGPPSIYEVCVAADKTAGEGSTLGTELIGQLWRIDNKEKEYRIRLLSKGIETELITSKGFPCENYWVTTEDGYILNVLRIPHGRNTIPHQSGPKPVVVLQHGLLGSATNFLTNLVNESLAYILADAGAEVWLGNSRGNIYSLNHTTLNPKEDAFWQFSFDEMAKYDLPAMIKFIVEKSRQVQIYYVGHSQGTAIGFIQFGEDPELASFVKHFFALAPVGRITHIKSPIRELAPLAKEVSTFFEYFGHGDFWVSTQSTRSLAAELCQSWGEILCSNILFVVCGFDFKSFNLSRVPVYLGHNPAGTAVQNVLHFAQEINAKEFQKFDFGTPEENMKHYAQPSPPLYDPSKVTIPVAIFTGTKDWLSDPEDVDWLLPQLNVTHHINIAHYAHLDFIWAVDAPQLIYSTILKVIFQ